MPSTSTPHSLVRDQGAPESHLKRLTDLITLAEKEPGLLAIFLVGSYAKGVGDRVSDLDLVVIADTGHSSIVLQRAQELLCRAEILNHFSGMHPAGGSFSKLVYLDFSSVEIHVFEPDTKFRLKKPYLAIWDPKNLQQALVVEGEPIQHEDFPAYEYGDEGLIWELIDCIKWLSRGRNALAKRHIEKIAAELSKQVSSS